MRRQGGLPVGVGFLYSGGEYDGVKKKVCQIMKSVKGEWVKEKRMTAKGSSLSGPYVY